MRLLRAGLAVVFALISFAPISPAPAWGQSSRPASRPTTRAAASSADALQIRSLLVRPPTARGTGTVVSVDPLLASIADGTFTTPTLGDPWAWLEPMPSGTFQDRRLVGGWAYAEVESDADRVMLLRAAGHTMVYVNGEPRAGDVYSHGYLALPVKLAKGTNSFLFQVGRGQLSARLEPVASEIVVLTDDATLPDLRDRLQSLALGVVVVNTGNTPRTVRAVLQSVPPPGPDGVIPPTPLIVPARPLSEVVIPPCSVRRVIVKATASGFNSRDGRQKVTVLIEEGPENQPRLLSTADFQLQVRGPDQVRRVTFVSDIDGSLQYYAVRPATQPSKGNALVLSLHGASVEAQGQAEAYGPHADAQIVAATNRRPFGFDWEDWGRLDALEVLAHARASLPHDPARVYLTGHSMGGHGTWHLGVNHPGLFAAISPSAGWISFATYSPGRAATRATTRPALQAFRDASRASDTLSLIDNLTGLGIFILHGDADDNVPVTEARRMAEALKPFHKDWSIHEQKGAGHWWDVDLAAGADCVDHPKMWELFDRRRLPAPEGLREIQFTTVSPAVHAGYAWLTLDQQQRSGEPSKVDLKLDPEKRRVVGTVENVSRLSVDAKLLGWPDVAEWEINGRVIPGGAADTQGRVWWPAARPADALEKTHVRAGPLKLALQNRMAFIYGTRGTPEENALNYQKARYDAEMWHYRANGAVDLLPDTHPTLLDDPDRTLVVYGNADTNAAFIQLHPRCPIQVTRGAVTIGGSRLEGDQTAIFCYPRIRSSVAMVVAISPTTPRAARASMRLPIFTSGLGWPDYAVISADALKVGPPAIREAGFFGPKWDLDAK